MIHVTDLVKLACTDWMKLVMMPAMIIFFHIVAVGMIFLMMMVTAQVGQRCSLRILVRLPCCSEQDLPVAVGHLLKDLQRLRLGGRRRGRRRGGLSGGGPRDHPVRNGRRALPRGELGRVAERGRQGPLGCRRPSGGRRGGPPSGEGDLREHHRALLVHLRDRHAPHLLLQPVTHPIEADVLLAVVLLGSSGVGMASTSLPVSTYFVELFGQKKY